MKYIYNNYYPVLYKPREFTKNGKTQESKILKEKNWDINGYYLDYDLLSPIFYFLEKPDENINFLSLMEKCIGNALNSCVVDLCEFYSNDSFKKYCHMNKCLFFEDGTRYYDIL